eukprot:c17957_g1_i1 orf=133-369(+)
MSSLDLPLAKKLHVNNMESPRVASSFYLTLHSLHKTTMGGREAATNDIFDLWKLDSPTTSAENRSESKFHLSPKRSRI